MNIQTEGIIRNLLVVAGAWLLGRNLFGATVTPELWQEISGTVLMIFSLIWTIKAKELKLEILQSVILKVVMLVGTIIVASGNVVGDYIDKIIMTVTVVLPIIYSALSKKKSEGIANGEISVSKLAK